jgi:hypothetical protein
MRDLPNMGQKDRGKPDILDVPSRTSSTNLTTAPISQPPQTPTLVPSQDAAKGTIVRTNSVAKAEDSNRNGAAAAPASPTTWRQVLYEKWRLCAFIALAVILSRFSSRAWLVAHPSSCLSCLSLCPPSPPTDLPCHLIFSWSWYTPTYILQTNESIHPLPPAAPAIHHNPSFQSLLFPLHCSKAHNHTCNIHHYLTSRSCFVYPPPGLCYAGWAYPNSNHCWFTSPEPNHLQSQIITNSCGRGTDPLPSQPSLSIAL